MAVTVYSTPSCPYCTMAKNYLKGKGIAFTEYDVSRNPGKAEEMARKSGQQGVPVLDVNGRVMVGFKPTDIEAALRR